MAGDTAGKTIECLAAVAWEAKKPLSIETVQVGPPKAGEVRIKILYSGVCHSDAHVLNGDFPGAQFPVIIGHEGGGVVESCGAGVTDFHPGDHVIPLYVPQCGDCKFCKNPETNQCEKIRFVDFMPDGTSRFTCKGKPVFHFMGCSTFSQYTVVMAIALCKIDPKAPLEKVCLIGCGISTGYGAAVNTAKVTPGSSCAVWGMGGVGLAAIMGCKKMGASRIIAVDINPGKFEIAKTFGATECINPKDHDKPIQEVLSGLTDGGPDFTIECIGNVSTMRAAFDSCHAGWGVAVIIGVAPAGKEMSINPFDFLMGKKLRGSIFGGFKGKVSVPKLVEEYQSGKLKVDEFITHTMELDKINEGFTLMEEGKSIRSVVKISK